MVAVSNKKDRYDSTPKSREYDQKDISTWFPVAKSELHGLANHLDDTDAQPMAEQIRMMLHLAEKEYLRMNATKIK